ncbi:MAG: imidazole glycerol phosphate synthase subunit HisH [Gallionellaceae bacterium]|nr:imidazole glycerol phosphate synthase subunit HisH [Gallionellaceae bacterium]
MARIVVIDYGMGNLSSVCNALAAAGATPLRTRHPEELATADAIILPGVGAFAAGMENLRAGGFLPALREAVLEQGKPFLGICLGMQLLADSGSEHGHSAGLGLIPGRVERLAPPPDGDFRLPHIGWNDLAIRRHDGLYADLPDGENFYFVHSYVFVADDPGVVSSTCEHGVEFTASLEAGNISAVQFHPEKSHRAGLKLLSNWLSRVGKA